MNTRRFRVYSRPGCHLCEDLLDELLPLVRGRAVVETRNIEDDPRWLSDYVLRIPVVECAGEVLCEGRLDRAAVLQHLADSESAGQGR